MKVVTMSSQGQLTVPVGARKNCSHTKFLFEKMKNGKFVFTPIKIEIVNETKNSKKTIHKNIVDVVSDLSGAWKDNDIDFSEIRSSMDRSF